MRYWAIRFLFLYYNYVGRFLHQFYELWERRTFSIIFIFCEFLSMSSTLFFCLLFMNNISPLCSLSMSGIMPPVFWFSSLVSYWVRRFFIRLILRFFSSVFHWVRKFFIHHALSSFTIICVHAQRSLRLRKKAIVISWSLELKSRDR